MHNWYDYKHIGGDKQSPQGKYFHLADSKNKSASTNNWKGKCGEEFSVHFENQLLSCPVKLCHMHVVINSSYTVIPWQGSQTWMQCYSPLKLLFPLDDTIHCKHTIKWLKEDHCHRSDLKKCLRSGRLPTDCTRTFHLGCPSVERQPPSSYTAWRNCSEFSVIRPKNWTHME